MSPTLLTNRGARVDGGEEPESTIKTFEYVKDALRAGSDVPEAFSDAWHALPVDHPHRQFGLIRAALSAWSNRSVSDGGDFDDDVLDRAIRRRLAESSEAVLTADQARWAVLIGDRSKRVAVRRSRSVYPPAPPMPAANPRLEAAFKRASITPKEYDV